MGADPRFFERLGPLPAGELAGLLGAQLIGQADTAVVDVSTPDQAGDGDLFFLSGDAAAAPQSGAVGIVARQEQADALSGCAAVLVHGSPRAAFAQAASRLLAVRPHVGSELIAPDADIDETAQISPGAIIGPGAQIEAGVDIGPGAVIGPGVTIGRDTRIGARAAVMCAQIGARCEISAGAVVGEAGFGLAYEGGEVFTLPHLGRVIVEDEVTLGANATVDRGMLTDTRLGRGCRIDNLCHIAHNVDVGEFAVMAAFAGVSGSAKIGKGAQFGGRVGVADHLTIGDGARLAADAAVMRDVPGGETWAGSPAQPIQRFMRETAWLRRESGRRGRRNKGES